MSDITWVSKYWDALYQIKWDPEHIALKSIPATHFLETEGRISVPRELVKYIDAPLYTRSMDDQSFLEKAATKEDLFNHILEIFWGILPGEILSDLFGPLAGNPFDPSLRSVGTEVWQRLGWGRHTNIMQQDGFFVSDRTLLAVEIKTKKTPTSLDQALKYAFLLAKEQAIFGRRETLRLLYIVPSGGEEKIERQIRYSLFELKNLDADTVLSSIRNVYVRKFIAENESEYRDTLRRMEIRIVSWSDFHARLQDLQDTLGDSPGDKTLRNLIQGAKQAIRDNAGTNL